MTVRAGRVKTNIDGIQRLRTPFVRTAEGKGVYRTLSFCAFKLRTFETSHRGNATVSVCVGELYPNYRYIIMYSL